MSVQTIYHPPRDDTADSYWRRRAAGFVGISDPKDSFWFFDDFATPGYIYERVVGSGGTAQAMNSREGGVVETITGSGATTYFLAGRTAGAGLYPSFGTPGTGGEWYMAARLRVITTPASNGRMGFLLRDASSGDLDNLVLGVEGAASTSKYCIYGDGSGSGVLSDTSIDNDNFVVLEAYRTGTTTRILVNEAEEGTPADVYPGGRGQIAFGGTGGTATSAYGIFDWVAYMSKARKAA